MVLIKGFGGTVEGRRRMSTK